MRLVTAILATTLVLSMSLTAYASTTGDKVQAVEHIAQGEQVFNSRDYYMNSLTKYAGIDLLGHEAQSGIGHIIRYIGEPNANGIQKAVFVYDNGGQEEVFIKGNLFTDSTGQLHGLLADGTMAVNGEYNGYLWNESGLMVSSMDTVFLKYKPDWDSWYPTITFDNQTELADFIIYLQMVMSDDQNLEFTMVTGEDGRITISKEQVYNQLRNSVETEQLMYNVVGTIIEQVNRRIGTASTDKDTIEAALAVISQEMKYDQSKMLAGMKESLLDKKGVCYHCTKLTAEVLGRLGFEYRYIIGTVYGQSHCWLTVKERAGDKWYTVDPSSYWIVEPSIYLEYFTPDRINNRYNTGSTAISLNT